MSQSLSVIETEHESADTSASAFEKIERDQDLEPAAIEIAASTEKLASGWAVASFFLSVASTVFWIFTAIPAPVFAALGVLFGIFGLKAIHLRRLEGRQLAWIGIAVGLIHILLTLLVFSHVWGALLAGVVVALLAWWGLRGISLGLLFLLILLGFTIVGVAATSQPYPFG